MNDMTKSPSLDVKHKSKNSRSVGVFFIIICLLLFQNTIFRFNEWCVSGVSKYFLFSVFYSGLTSLIVYKVKYRFLKVLFYFLLILLASTNFFLAYRFHSSISPSTLLLIAETNTQESLEFINTYLFSSIGITCLLSFLTICAFIFILEREEWRLYTYYSKPLFCHIYRKWGYLILSVLAIWIFYDSVSLYNCQSVAEAEKWSSDCHQHIKPMDNISNLHYCVCNLLLARREQKQSENLTIETIKIPSTISTNDSTTVVMVIGESYNKWHSKLYGYPLNTCPNLLREKKSGNLFVFTNVVSPYNITSRVLRNVFSTNAIGMREHWPNYPFFPAVFRSAGYEVNMYDNQFNPYSKESFDFSLNAYLHSKSNHKYVYSSVNQRNYELDGKLIEAYKKSYSYLHPTKYQFIIFHLMGQHFSYYNRFPHNGRFDHFLADSIMCNEPYMTKEKRQLIADYDNATYYNDEVINQIIELFKNRNTVMVYFADHGEEIYDYRDFSGRIPEGTLDKNVLKYHFSVPFFIWCSDKYMENNKNQIESIKMARKRPLSIDNVCHLFFRLGHINTPLYLSNRDVLDSSYNCPPRIINDNFTLIEKSMMISDF